MAKSNDNFVLFDKDRENEGSDDIWDDRALIRAYDRSIQKIKNQLKSGNLQDKKIAGDLKLDEEDDDNFLEEDEFDEEKEGYCDEDEDEADLTQFNKKFSKKKSKEWSIGDLCMAIYTEDGLLYPAKIKNIFSDSDVNRKKCVIKFLYYLNEEEKYLDELYEYKEENEKIVKDEEKFSGHDKIELERNFLKSSSLNFQIPPPPLPAKIINNESNTAEQDALHSMLLSWYMNGYHTGYYVGLTQNKS